MIHPSRSESCLSDYALDMRLAGELAAEEDTGARDHLVGCARCARRWSGLRAERDAFEEDAPRLRLGAPRAPAARLRWIATGGALLVAAAVLLLFVRGAPRDAGLRAKGGRGRFGFYVSHAGAVRQGAAGERVESGDALRFAYVAREARYLAVLSVDGAKHASTYYPDSRLAA